MKRIYLLPILVLILAPITHALEVNLPVDYNPFDTPPYHIKVTMIGSFSDVNSIAFYDSSGNCLPVARLSIYPSKILAYLKTNTKTNYVRAVFGETCETNEPPFVFKSWRYIAGGHSFYSLDPTFFVGNYFGGIARLQRYGVYNFQFLYAPANGYDSTSAYIFDYATVPIEFYSSQCAPLFYGGDDGKLHVTSSDFNYTWEYDPSNHEENYDYDVPMIKIEYNGTENPAPYFYATIKYEGNPPIELNVPMRHYWNGSQKWCYNTFYYAHGYAWTVNNYMLVLRVKSGDLWKFYILGYDSVSDEIVAAVITYNPSSNSATYVLSSAPRNGVIPPSAAHRTILIKDAPGIEQYVYIWQYTRGIYVFDRSTDRLVFVVKPSGLTLFSESEAFRVTDGNVLEVVKYHVENGEYVVDEVVSSAQSPYSHISKPFGASPDWGFLAELPYGSYSFVNLVKVVDPKATATDAPANVSYSLPEYTSQKFRLTVDPLYHRVDYLLYRNGEVYKSGTFQAFSGEQNVEMYLPAGAWLLEIYQDGQLIQSKSFGVGYPPLDVTIEQTNIPFNKTFYSEANVDSFRIYLKWINTAPAYVVLNRYFPDGSREKVAEIGCFDAGEHEINNTYFLPVGADYVIDFHLDYNGCNPYGNLVRSVMFSTVQGSSGTEFFGNFNVESINETFDFMNRAFNVFFTIFLSPTAYWLILAGLVAESFIADSVVLGFASFIFAIWIGYWLGYLDVWVALLFTLIALIYADEKGYIHLGFGKLLHRAKKEEEEKKGGASATYRAAIDKPMPLSEWIWRQNK